MANNYYEHDNPFVAGTLVASAAVNSQLDLIETGFEAAEATLAKTVQVPSDFTGITQIPSQTFPNKLIYINTVGDVDLYSLAAFDASVTASADSATASADSAAAAANSATAAATQVGLATDQVGLATDQVGLATTQVGLATTQVGLATTQVGLATTQAGLATDQVGLATTQASDAAISATAAAAAAADKLPDFFTSMVGDKIFIVQTGQSNPQGFYTRSQANNVNTWYNPKVWDWQWSARTANQSDAMRADPTYTTGGNWGWVNPNPTQSGQVFSSVYAIENIGYLGANTGNQAYAMANEIQIATQKEVYVLNLTYGGQSVSQWQAGGSMHNMLKTHVQRILSGNTTLMGTSTTVSFGAKLGPEIVTWGQGEQNAIRTEVVKRLVNARKGVFDEGKQASGWIADEYTKIFLTETSEYCNWTGTAFGTSPSPYVLVPWRWEGPNRLERYSGTDVKLISSMGIESGNNAGTSSSVNYIGSVAADPVHFTGDGNDMYGRRIAHHILGKSVGTSIVSQELQRELLPKLGGNLDTNGKSFVNGALTYTLPTASGEFTLTTSAAKQTFTGGLLSKGAGTDSTRLAENTGGTTQGDYAVALGYGAGQQYVASSSTVGSQPANSISINASGANTTTIDLAGANDIYIGTGTNKKMTYTSANAAVGTPGNDNGADGTTPFGWSLWGGPLRLTGGLVGWADWNLIPNIFTAYIPKIKTVGAIEMNGVADGNGDFPALRRILK